MTEVLDRQVEVLAAMDEAARPRKEHAWLQQLIGEWDYEIVREEPGKPPVMIRGTGVRRAVGELWTISEGKSDTPGGCPPAMVRTLGYDPRKGRFVGTWISSMMSHLWVYEGFLDADERVLTLETVGPSFTRPGAMIQYRNFLTVVDHDYHTMTGTFLGDDGQWKNETMTMHFRRKK